MLVLQAAACTTLDDANEQRPALFVVLQRPFQRSKLSKSAAAMNTEGPPLAMLSTTTSSNGLIEGFEGSVQASLAASASATSIDGSSAGSLVAHIKYQDLAMSHVKNMVTVLTLTGRVSNDSVFAF
jgi:hypothetical protein